MTELPGEVHGRNVSMGDYLTRRYLQLDRALACAARTEEEWLTWRDAFKRKLHELMAPWPNACPLDPIIIERVPCDGYVREKVLFRSEEDMCVPAYVLTPAAAPPADSGRYPAVVCQHGHGFGKDDVVGLTHGTLERWRVRQALHYDFGPGLAQRGYVVIAMDARGFGERALGYPTGSGEYGCNMVQIKAQLLGLNLLTLNVFDVTRCIDYVLSRPDVDPARVGCLGLSYGGTLALFAAALDERITATIVSGYLGSLYEQTFVRGDTCGQQIVPNLLCWGELSDVACLIAPRALLVESGTDDDLFGIGAAKEAYSRVQHLYETIHAPEKVSHHVFVGGHRWDGSPAQAWLDRWL